ncbi:hypothetical protein Neosp_012954 [[Neocosmospora] mangrovei]
MISKLTPPRVAILRNYDTPASWGNAMVDSWRAILKATIPDAEVEVYHPITDGILPDATKFNVVILTGGVFNLTLPKVDPWVEQTLAFIRDTAENCPSTKMVGVCWGHQAITRAMGGEIEFNPYGDRVGVHPLQFTERGLEFFGSSKNASDPMAFALPEFHKRRVGRLPPGSVSLAEGNEILFYEDKNIITFQGHPEMPESVGKGILDADDGAYKGGLSEREVEEMYARFSLPHDGPRMFQKVVDWIFEEV